MWRSSLRNNPCLCVLHHPAPDHYPSAQLSLFVYLIYWRMPKRNRCSVLVPLFYSTPLCKKSGLQSIELSECIIVIYGDLTFKLSFATKHYFQFSWGEGRGTERENELMPFRCTDPKDRWETWECLWTSTLFLFRRLLSLTSVGLYWVGRNISHRWNLYLTVIVRPISLSKMDIIQQSCLISFFLVQTGDLGTCAVLIYYL